MALVRTILALTRPARLPTVWSNCLAGWWLGGDRDWEGLPLLLAAASFLFFGGAFLNDAFDADFDREHRPYRPIPAGAVAAQTVWRWGLAWLSLGALLLLWLSKLTGALGLVLVLLIVLYTAAHRQTSLAPMLKGLCRCVLYLLGASISARGITGWPIWCGLALAIYVSGVGRLALWEEQPKEARYWPLLLLVVPIALALLMDITVDLYREHALLVSAVLVLWVIRSLRYTFFSPEPNLRQTLPGLLAGIVFVDWLAVADAPRQVSFIFLGFFAATVLLQKLVPEK